ncbi:MAG: hypothetical protein MRZ92_05170 [Lactobacillus sp.]|jgi:hypothetical protein|uniref:hypothetical protein n=1 Tax=Limosilactobacillus coleohominis TaxID=181675 RepID=UPI0015BCFEE9|nr:hypothetical protein [Limosilactobacillus coleohominis]MCI5812884.1 hypothetical protein [Lactobacillus sp.]MDY5627986.1 hypothetical protein [Limosilactobacillus coleohominis]
MSLMWLIIISIVIVVIIYELTHRILIKRATLIVQRRAQSITDQIVFDVLNDKLNVHDCDQQSTLVSDIWGKGVLSFEYNIGTVDSVPVTRDELERQLNQLAIEKNVDFFQKAPQAFKITDWWQGKKKFHMDVTYLMNEASYEYVQDLHKLGE